MSEAFLGVTLLTIPFQVVVDTLIKLLFLVKKIGVYRWKSAAKFSSYHGTRSRPTKKVQISFRGSRKLPNPRDFLS